MAVLLRSRDLMKQAESIVQSLGEGKTVEAVPEALSTLFRPSVQPYLASWFRYDPAEEIKKLSMPVLIVQGTTDLQVSIEDAQSLENARLSATAKKSGMPGKLCVIAGMNHVLKLVAGDRKEQMQSYIDPALPVAPQLIDETSRFIKGLKVIRQPQ
jgi:fermentation-respiration switch protein FrsA (DUF1100 family)